jgi:predicted alpha/beta hydrolase family esterase
MAREATVLIVPGLRDHVPQHWQTLLASRLPAQLGSCERATAFARSFGQQTHRPWRGRSP